MPSFLRTKDETHHKNKILFLPMPDHDNMPLSVIVLILYSLFFILAIKYLWPVIVGRVAIYFIYKFTKKNNTKIISICLVVLLSLLGSYVWLNKVNRDSEINKAQQAIIDAQKAEQKQKDNAEKAKKDAANREVKAQADAKAKEQMLSELTPVCVTNHKSLFKPKIQELLDGTEATPQSATRKQAYTSDECKLIITGLQGKGYDKKEIQRVAEAKFGVGMEEKLLYFSIGLPNDYSNSTTTIFGTSSQFVYGDPLNNATYIYVDNGKVTSYQN